jgi:predicted nucleic acid-binding protein
VTEVGRDLLVPEPVIAEVDQLSRSRVGTHAARRFLESIAAGEHPVVNISPRLLRRAVELDSAFADLDLGYLDAAVMTTAQRDRLPVLTFDFEHFHATRPDHGSWQLVIDQHRYQTHTRSQPPLGRNRRPATRPGRGLPQPTHASSPGSTEPETTSSCPPGRQPSGLPATESPTCTLPVRAAPPATATNGKQVRALLLDPPW